MSEVRDTQENLFALITVSDFEQRVSHDNLLVFYTEAVVGHEVRDTNENLLVLYTVPDVELPTVDCSFGSSFQPGVLKGQGVCE